MSYFRITLLRSAIGLPEKYSGVLRALGLRRRMKTVYHPVSPSVAGQIFAVKELVDVQEVDRALSDKEMKELRRPDPGFYVESRARDMLSAYERLCQMARTSDELVARKEDKIWEWTKTLRPRK